jgi:uncharacterized protein YkwD
MYIVWLLIFILVVGGCCVAVIMTAKVCIEHFSPLYSLSFCQPNARPPSSSPKQYIPEGLKRLAIDPGPSKCSPAEVSETVFSHNLVRAWHNAPPLTWSPELARTAQQHADFLSTRSILSHSRSGENLMRGGTRSTADGATLLWYGEYPRFRFNVPNLWTSNFRNFGEWGHFSQVIWKSTLRVGCGRTVRGSRSYIVCHYDPPGNVSSDYHFNQNMERVYDGFTADNKNCCADIKGCEVAWC